MKERVKLKKRCTHFPPIMQPFSKIYNRKTATKIQKRYYSNLLSQKNTDIKDKQDPTEEKSPQEKNVSQPSLSFKSECQDELSITISLNIDPSTSQKTNDSECENLQLPSIQKTHPSALKQSLNNSKIDPYSSKSAYKINELLLPPDIWLALDSFLKYQKKSKSDVCW